MKTIIGVICAVILGAASGAARPAHHFSWVELDSLWNKYYAYPSADNAGLLYQALPESTGEAWAGDTAGSSKTLNTIFEIAQLPILEKQVYSGDSNAVRVAFKMMTTLTGGDATEWLDQLLGNLIRINPALFLRELKSHRRYFSRGIDGWFQDAGLDYVDNVRKQELELGLRSDALRSVRDPDLAAIRDEVIASFGRK